MGGLHDRPAQLRVLRNLMKYRSLPMLGETLDIAVKLVGRRDGVGDFSVHVTENVSRRDIMSAEFRIALEP